MSLSWLLIRLFLDWRYVFLESITTLLSYLWSHITIIVIIWIICQRNLIFVVYISLKDFKSLDQRTWQFHIRDIFVKLAIFCEKCTRVWDFTKSVIFVNFVTFNVICKDYIFFSQTVVVLQRQWLSMSNLASQMDIANRVAPESGSGQNPAFFPNPAKFRRSRMLLPDVKNAHK